MNLRGLLLKGGKGKEEEGKGKKGREIRREGEGKERREGNGNKGGRECGVGGNGKERVLVPQLLLCGCAPDLES